MEDNFLLNDSGETGEVSEEKLECLREQLRNAKTIFDADDILTNYGFYSPEGKMGFLMGLFKLSAPRIYGDYAKYESILKFIIKKD